MFGSIISAGANILGGILNRDAAKDANRIQQEQAALNRKTQMDFAKHGIKWKVDDARRAGVHPLYALGAQTHSYSPVSVGTTVDTSMGNALASAGQDISRAFAAGATPKGRVDAFTTAVQGLSLEKASLENELLKSQIARLNNSQVPPPTPSAYPVVIPEGKLDDRTPIVLGSRKIATHPGFSDGQTFEDRWGEWGGSAAGLVVMGADALHNARQNTKVERAPFSWIPRFEYRQ